MKYTIIVIVFFIVVLNILFLLKTKYLDWVYFGPNSEKSGKKAEKVSAKEISKIFKQEPARNVLLTKHDGNTTEIDMALATVYGILVVEVKYRFGKVFAEARTDRWKIVRTDEIVFMDNPLKQNVSHMHAIENYLKNHGIKHIKSLNIVRLFAYNNAVVETDESLKETFIFTRANDWKRIKKLPVVYTQEEVDNINKLLVSAIGSKDALLQHSVDQIVRKRGYKL